jgi:hypothetical protein
MTPETGWRQISTGQLIGNVIVSAGIWVLKVALVIAMLRWTGVITMSNLPMTDRGHRVLALANKEAVLLGHHWVGTEHLLLGLLVERDGIAGAVLRGLGVTEDKVRAEIERLVLPANKCPTCGGTIQEDKS